jgi:hypothetical protein
MTEAKLPPLRIETCDAARREPGLMVFNIRAGGQDSKMIKTGWIVALDQAGDVAFSLTLDAPTQDVRLHPNGNIFFSQPGRGAITEMDRTGQALRHWHVAGPWQGKEPPAGSTAIDLERMHHTLNVLPNGNLLLLTSEVRVFDDWPGSVTDADAPPEQGARLVGDVIVEVALDGTVVNRWRTLDMLDPYRISYGSRRDHWVKRGIPDSFDWAHANCASPDPGDDSIIASLRTQDCIIKFDRASGALKWILGTPANWREPWSEKLLKPEGPLDWAYHQHDCSVTPTGTVLCFDNGNHRASPFDPPMAEADSYSRIVEFAVDEDAGTVRQVWCYGDAPQDRLFACFQGGAYRLPLTGNTFATYGGVATIDGVPSADNANGFGRARLMELSPDNEVLFDMWVDTSGEEKPWSLSVFRAEHVPNAA